MKFYVPDAQVYFQRLVSVNKMTTVLEEGTTKEQRSVVRFSLWEKGLNAKDIRKEMFPVYGGKFLSRKRFTTSGKCSADDEEVETEVRKCLRTTVKRLLCCGFRRTGKAMGQVYQCLWKIW
jgi:hypothetical protein